MTTEDRLREALAATAALVHLEDQPQTVPARTPRRIAPLAVAAAVLVILAGVVFGLRGEGDPAPAVSPGVAAPARYFMAKIGGGNTTTVSVRDIQTGRVTATVTPPSHSLWTEVSATADPHVFYATSAPDFGTRNVETSLYRLTIDATGRLRTRTKAGALTRNLPLAFAAAPDGTRVAFSSVTKGLGPATIEVLTVSSGRRTVYRTSTTGFVSELSWSADGRYLAFQLLTQLGTGYNVRILDTRAGHDLIRDSRPVLTGGRSYVSTYVAPVLSADGRHVYLLAAATTKGHRSIRVLELDARTGRQLRVMYEQPHTGKGGNPIWEFLHLARDPTGTMLLVVDPSGRAHRIDIASRHVETMPFPGGVPNAFTW